MHDRIYHDKRMPIAGILKSPGNQANGSQSLTRDVIIYIQW